MDKTTLLFIGDLILFAGFPGLLLFTGFYGIRSRWRADPAGRAVFYLALSLTLIVALVAWSRLADRGIIPFPFREWIRIAVYVFTSISLWRMFTTLIHHQRLDRRRIRREKATHKATPAQPKENPHE